MTRFWLLGAVLAFNIATVSCAPDFETALKQANISANYFLEYLSNTSNYKDRLYSATNVTVLVPLDAGFDAIYKYDEQYDWRLDEPLGWLPYHIIDGVHTVPNPSSQFLPTWLTDSKYTTMKDGQIVWIEASDLGLEWAFGGGRWWGNIKQENISWSGGLIHVIDSPLQAPTTAVDTVAGDILTRTSYSKFRAAGLFDEIDALDKVTVFVPNYEAYGSITNILAAMSPQEISDVLHYHVVPNTALYTADWSNNGTTVTTLAGKELQLTVYPPMVANGEDDEDYFVREFYVNSAIVDKSNIIIANGVIHTIDNVLNPWNTTADPDTVNRDGQVAFANGTTYGPGFPVSSVSVASSSLPTGTGTGTATVSGTTSNTASSTASGNTIFPSQTNGAMATSLKLDSVPLSLLFAIGIFGNAML